jgi:putative tryptophan/tyrosine transport system substrate-binding protein
MESINALAVKHKMANMWPVRIAVETGALVSYGPDVENMYVHAIGHADKILRGVKPGDLPIEMPTTYELVINLKRAKELGLTVPRHVRVRATTVIE